MTRFPARRFTIMQLGTLLSFTLYIVGGTALVVGVLRPPQEFLLAIGSLGGGGDGLCPEGYCRLAGVRPDTAVRPAFPRR
ncbi:hypothetical protein UMZ34_03575 [Halopseudomonas pachastrellae]|nr:hypothetical protein UMZ34_03575 [Halopseudomonas pachastrellae]